MRVSTGTLEKIFLPVLSGILLSGVGALFNFHTDLKVLETKVETNHEKIGTIFRKLDEIREDQKEVLKLLLEMEHDKVNER